MPASQNSGLQPALKMLNHAKIEPQNENVDLELLSNFLKS